MDAADIYFHLGLEKTGSTFYQNRIFKNLKNIRYHRKSRFKYYPQIISRYPESRHLFTYESDLLFNETVDLVAKHLPGANVFIVLRRQDSWLSSRYNYHIRKHGYFTLLGFFDLDGDNGFWKKQYLYLKPKIDYAKSKLNGRLLFLNYHELKENPELFIGRMTSFLHCELKPGTDINKPMKKAFSLKQNRILMGYNKLNKYKMPDTKNKTLRKTYKTYREFLLHTVAFLARAVPSAWVSKKPLIDQAYLKRVKDHYDDDWAYALRAIEASQQEIFSKTNTKSALKIDV